MVSQFSDTKDAEFPAIAPTGREIGAFPFLTGKSPV